MQTPAPKRRAEHAKRCHIGQHAIQRQKSYVVSISMSTAASTLPSCCGHMPQRNLTTSWGLLQLGKEAVEQ